MMRGASYSNLVRCLCPNLFIYCFLSAFQTWQKLACSRNIAQSVDVTRMRFCLTMVLLSSACPVYVGYVLFKEKPGFKAPRQLNHAPYPASPPTLRNVPRIPIRGQSRLPSTILASVSIANLLFHTLPLLIHILPSGSRDTFGAE
ncbi:uncharacterized protein BDW70DRAFT_53841 [Aspergillus foveolatus]|uniref:uncharacterized protein n=1 Tax=Aspergillus foveolatus TaxID=210207 RepID=UPI003CCCD024